MAKTYAIKSELLNALEEISKSSNTDKPQELSDRDLQVLFLASLLEEEN